MNKRFISLAIVSVLGASMFFSCALLPRRGPGFYYNNAGSQNSSPVNQPTSMEMAVNRAGTTMINAIPDNLTVVLLNVSPNGDQMGTFVVEELKMRLAGSQKYRIIDERSVNSGNQRGGFRQNAGAEEMTDASAIAFGQRAVANAVITVSITRTGLTQTLTVKALDTQTSGIISMFRETL